VATVAVLIAAVLTGLCENLAFAVFVLEKWRLGEKSLV
jgi:hypothetical protein